MLLIAVPVGTFLFSVEVSTTHCLLQLHNYPVTMVCCKF